MMPAATTALDDPARRLAGLFAEFDRYRRALEQRATLRTADMRLLWLFTDGTARTLREIAQSLGLEQSTVNRQVNAAVNAGLLARERAGAPAPYRFVATSQGIAEFEQNLDLSLGAYRAALGALGDADSARFLALMRRYVDEYRGAVFDDASELAGSAAAASRR